MSAERKIEKGRRSLDPEQTRRNIIEVAMKEFARSGLSGARVDEIAEKTLTSKRMIYYYFKDKEGLYLSALEHAYRQVREGEAQLVIDNLDPVEGLAKLVEFTFDHHQRNEDFIRMVMIENIHHGEYLARSEAIKALNVTAISHVERLYSRGVEQMLFRPQLKPVEIHWQISALCFFNVSNRATFSQLFAYDLDSAAQQKSLRANAVEMILRHVLRDDRLHRINTLPQ